MKKYNLILLAAGAAAIDALVPGLPVNEAGFFLTEQDMDNIQAKLEDNETAMASLQGQLNEGTTALATANEALTATQASLAAANAAIVTKDETIAALEAKVLNLERSAAGELDQTVTTEDTPPAGAEVKASKYVTSVDKAAQQYK